MPEITLAIDAMGGDNGPSIVIEALAEYISSSKSCQFLVVGQQDIILPLLKQFQLSEHPQVKLIHADQVVEMNEKPGQALRSKPDSSMSVALQLLAKGEADAMVSGGNTGALMAKAYFQLKTLPGVLRPALMAALPNARGGRSYLLDLGANASCDSETLFQFGVMGSVAAQVIESSASPKVSLLNMGEEDIKGNDVVKNAAQRLSASEHVNYRGFIEGNHLFSGKADVIVCDGFVGNIALKSCEGLATLIVEQMKSALMSHWMYRWFFRFLQKRTQKSWEPLKPDHYNGASLIGLRGVVIKSHGSANSKAFGSAIKQAVTEAHAQLPERIKDRVESVLLEQH
ncbi:phosphate acyltransferase PlsX [Idiomarina seosinensis]|uniref:phosphate acyltransferase PlsX n=1 Tax=Idiomarina seosinensis TaxID=281739 RepID=UPI003850441C